MFLGNVLHRPAIIPASEEAGYNTGVLLQPVSSEAGIFRGVREFV
jgi:hypothetical protein